MNEKRKFCKISVADSNENLEFCKINSERYQLLISLGQISEHVQEFDRIKISRDSLENKLSELLTQRSDSSYQVDVSAGFRDFPSKEKITFNGISYVLDHTGPDNLILFVFHLWQTKKENFDLSYFDNLRD